MARSTATPVAPIADLKTPVHLRANNPAATMEATPPDGQPFPLNEPGGMPFNDSTTTAEKISSLQKAIAFLEVSDPRHTRYTPADGKTFCNIYAYDLAYLMGRNINQYYIPRVWWTGAAVAGITAGVPQTPTADVTLQEMTANALHDWFAGFGRNFGWTQQTDLTTLQQIVNTTGDIGVIVGKKAVGHGHITIVVPESAVDLGSLVTAMRTAGKVTNPLQSQAGATNFEFGHSTIGSQPWFNTDGHVSSFYSFSS